MVKKLVHFTMVVCLAMVMWATPASANSLITCDLAYGPCNGNMSQSDVLEVLNPYNVDQLMELIPLSEAKILLRKNYQEHEEVTIKLPFQIDLLGVKYMTIVDLEGSLKYQVY